MRIGVNCFLLQEHVGGIKEYFISLFKELLANDFENEYVLFYFKENLKELPRLETERWRDHAILLTSQDEVGEHLDKMDLYFCPFGTLWPRPLPLPTVVTLVDIQEVFYPEFFTYENLVARAYHYQGSTTVADQVVTISQYSKDTIVQHHGIEADKVTVAHLCADIRFARAAEIARRPAKPLPEKFVFYPANHWFHKNHDVLLRALQWLKLEKNIMINAVFTGHDQENGYQIGRKAAEYGISEQVTQLGYISTEELAYLYRHARLMVFPSLFEGFGIPLVEAMAAGCPVVASRSTSLPEIGLESVVYFDPTSATALGEAIVQVSFDDELRHDLILSGKKRALDFSPAQLAQKHLRVFAEAANSFSRYKYLRDRWLSVYIHKARVAVKALLFILKRCLGKINKRRSTT